MPAPSDARSGWMKQWRDVPKLEPAPWANALATAADRGWIVDETISMGAHVIAAIKGDGYERYTSNSGASLGWGTGAAIGVALATGGPVTCVLGDGTTRFGMSALWNARAYDLPIVFLVVDNGGFGSTRSFERHYVETLKPRPHGDAGYVGSDLSQLGPPVATLFKGFDIPCVSVRDGPDVGVAMEQAWNTQPKGPRAVVVDVGFDAGAF